jgi:hypothetical protein
MRLSSFVMALLAGSLSVAGAAAPNATAAPKERKICRVKEDLGSILPRRTCRTRKDWAKIDAEQAEITENDTGSIRENPGTSLHDPAPK